MVVHHAVADQLHLGHTRDGLEIRVKDGLLLATGLLLPCPQLSLAGSNACASNATPERCEERKRVKM